MDWQCYNKRIWLKGCQSSKLLRKYINTVLWERIIVIFFPRESVWRASKILQLIYSNICGPISPISNSKKRYLIIFIDDYNRRTWVYFPVEKSEAFAMFKMYKARVEEKTWEFIRGLRIDWEGEFTSHEFISFCNKNDIHI